MEPFSLSLLIITICDAVMIYPIYYFFNQGEELLSKKYLKIMIYLLIVCKIIFILPIHLKLLLAVIIFHSIIYVSFKVNFIQAFLGSLIIMLIYMLAELISLILVFPFMDTEAFRGDESLTSRLIGSAIYIISIIVTTKLSSKNIRKFIFSKSILKKNHITISSISLALIIFISFANYISYNDLFNLTNTNLYIWAMFPIFTLVILYLVYKLDSILKKSITDNPADIKKEILPGRVLVNGRLVKIGDFDYDYKA